jgi:hypothetical protein
VPAAAGPEPAGGRHVVRLGWLFGLWSGGQGPITGGSRSAAADTYRATELDRAARYGELQAVQSGAQGTRNLAITLGNIDATRAAAHDDPTSAAGAAVRGARRDRERLMADVLPFIRENPEGNGGSSPGSGGMGLPAAAATGGLY